MHPLVQQFAGEKLALGSEATSQQAHEAHARHFAALADRHEHDFHGTQDKQALAWMIAEADNIRAAWGWGVQRADAALLEPFLESFLYFFDLQGRYEEGIELTGQALRGVAGRPARPRRTGAAPRAGAAPGAARRIPVPRRRVRRGQAATLKRRWPCWSRSGRTGTWATPCFTSVSPATASATWARRWTGF